MKLPTFPLGTALTAGLLSLSTIALGPAQAQTACTNGVSASFLVGLGVAGCVIGDKQYGNFSFSANLLSSTGTYNFTNTDVDHTFSGAGLGLLTGTYTYSYDVVALDPTQYINIYRTDLGTSAIGGATASNQLANSVNALDSLASIPGSSPGNLVNIAQVPSGTPVTFTGTLTVSNGRIDTITDSLQQAPGPLPILGAGAAFGFSRKLRKRIKATA
ncbi:MAG: hypothetical protein ACKOPT_16420 [Cyanobium sp.]